jgi:hypothetical protein
MRRGDVKQYKIEAETWALEYAQGGFDFHSQSLFPIRSCWLKFIRPPGSISASATCHRLDPLDVALRTCRYGILHLGHRVVLQDGVSDGEGNDTKLVEGEDLSGGADSEVLAGSVDEGT